MECFSMLKGISLNLHLLIFPVNNLINSHQTHSFMENSLSSYRFSNSIDSLPTIITKICRLVLKALIIYATDPCISREICFK